MWEREREKKRGRDMVENVLLFLNFCSSHKSKDRKYFFTQMK